MASRSLSGPQLWTGVTWGGCCDLGADGFFAPQIHNAEDAAAAVRLMKYPPMGVRSDSGALFAARPNSSRMAEHANANTVLVVIVESREGAENVDEICQTPGVDAVSIGHADLSLSLGVPGDRESALYRAAEDRIVESCRKHNMPFTIGTAPSIVEARQQREQGCFTVFVDDEIGLITRSLSNYVEQLRRETADA